jgi:hypothetical protein
VDELLTNGAGSTWALDYFGLYGYCIVGVLGILLNIIAFLVFLDPEFSIPLYAYMRMYCINNACMCLLVATNFIFASYRLVPWDNTYWAQAYYAYGFGDLSAVFYLFGSLLDIVILLDRIGNFNKSVKASLTKLSPRQVGGLVVVLGILINVPYFIQYMPGKLVAPIGPNATFTVWFTQNTPMAMNPVGAAFIFLCYGLRDVGIVIAEVFLNCVSIIYLKRFLNKKKRITDHGHHNLSQNTGDQLNNSTSAADKSKGTTTMALAVIKPVAAAAPKKRKDHDHVSVADQKATVMVVFLIYDLLARFNLFY